MQSLSVLRNELGLSQLAFARGVSQMHGYPGTITEKVIADIEDPKSATKYPRTLLEEISLFLTRQFSGKSRSARLVEVEDVSGLAAKLA